ALAFGMKVIANHKYPERDKMEDVVFVDSDKLFSESDLVSLHAPLTKENEGLINAPLLEMMKPSAFLINTARGGFINEQDLKSALESGKIAGAALDVLSAEPPADGHALVGIENCLITPHVAWASKEARERLMQETILNIKGFLEGNTRNAVNF
ncbi:MAG: D-2-hydroxyacid dehydrogenase, partial [Bacteroidetes bacterium]